MEFPFINWIQKINVYETPTCLYLIGSDNTETSFRLLKITRSPIPVGDDNFELGDCSPPTIEAESPIDRLWRLNIFEDPHTYTSAEQKHLLQDIQDATKVYVSLQPGCKDSFGTSPGSPSSNSGWRRMFKKRRQKSASVKSSTVNKKFQSNVPQPPNVQLTHDAGMGHGSTQEGQRIIRSNATVGSSLSLLTKCYGIAGVVRFLRGYYLIVITRCRHVAQLGEHKIYKIEETSLIYIPGNQSSLNSFDPQSMDLTSMMAGSMMDDESRTENPSSSDQSTSTQTFSVDVNSRQHRMADEMRYLKLFNSVDLTSNFYFSYTYDLSRSLQYNLESVCSNEDIASGHVWAVRSIPNDRFIWNWRLIPLQFRPDRLTSNSTNDERHQPDWFVPLCHGSVKQGALSACGVPLYLTLIGRRSSHFAGTRFLKRGSNLVGDVANEVETEQIVHDTSHAFLRHARCSSYVQLRGSVPLFWSQESSKVVVGRPPLELLRDDPYFEAFGAHFADLLQRYGSPVIVFNLMKRREKRPFESALSEGFERGLTYLNQFLPSRISSTYTSDHSIPLNDQPESSPPIIYIGFDVARVQRHKNLVVLDQLHPVLDACVRRTGIFIRSAIRQSPQQPLNYGSIGHNSRQCGLIRTNCVDCLDRTNTNQFVVGRVVLAYQLYYIGFLDEPHIPSDSRIDRLLQTLYDELGDTLALQYGGSQLVHNIDTYKKTHKLSSQSRDLMQTLSRFYSNKFADWERQCAINVFLRVYRPALWTGTLFQFVCRQRYLCRMLPPRFLPSSQTDTNNPDSVLSAVASSAFGPLWDLPNDHHIHWLDAVARRLKRGQRWLTDWCSRELLDSLPIGLDLSKERIKLSHYVFQVPPDDKRVNWLDEQYQTSVYKKLEHLPLLHICFEVQSRKSHMNRRASIDGGQKRYADNGIYPQNSIRRSIMRKTAASSSSLTTLSELSKDSKNSNNRSPIVQLKRHAPSKATAAKSMVDNDNWVEEFSSDSDSGLSIDSFVKIYPSALEAFVSTGAASTSVNPSQLMGGPPHIPIQSPAYGSTPRLFDPHVNTTQYQRYLEGRSVVTVSPFHETDQFGQLQLKPVSIDSMKIYRNHIQTACGLFQPISESSMTMYRSASVRSI